MSATANGSPNSPVADPSECLICRLPFAPLQSNSNAVNNRECVFCHKVSSRPDAARRHEKTCPSNVPGHPHYHLRAHKKGRKTRACDACARIKVACTRVGGQGQPCQRCTNRSIACTYGWLCTIPEHRASQTTSRTRDDRRPQHDRAKAVSESRSQFPFLLNCTDPRINFVNDVMVPGEPEREPGTSTTTRGNTPTQLPLNQLPLPVGVDTIDPQLLFRGFMDPYFGLELDDASLFDVSMDFGIDTSPTTSSTLDNIKPRVILLESELLQMVAQLSTSDADIATKNYEIVKAFFGAAEFDKLLDLFFRRQQLLAKLIHWPTFDKQTANLGLLLAIALCGVAYSHGAGGMSSGDASLGLAAAQLQPLAEEYIFRRLSDITSLDGDHLQSPNLTAALQTCQAAYLIVLLQISVNNATNNHSTRRRAMTLRQPALVEAIRRLDMTNKKNNSIDDWHAFVHNESCSRLALWSMLNDGLLCLFCNSPPTMSIAEMVGDLPCDDDLWEAPSAEVYGSISLGASRGQAQGHSLKSVVSALMADSDAPSASLDGPLSVFHLYGIIGALQLVVFSYRSQCMPASMASPLLRALDRWDRLWHLALARIPADDRRWIGVARHSPEFSRIARRILRVSSEDSDANIEALRSQYMQCRPEFDLGVFHQFILEHGV